MNCWTPEAIARYAEASIEARREACEMRAAYARSSFAERISGRVNLRRLLEFFRQSYERIPRVRVHDAG
jgi:hypothetical protein